LTWQEWLRRPTASHSPAEDLPPDLRPGGRGQAASAGEDRSAPLELDLGKTTIGTVIWATGYWPDLTWVRMPFLDADRFPIKRRGVTSVKGLYVLGLDWLHTAKSGLFAGIGDDASYLASVITSRPLSGGNPRAPVRTRSARQFRSLREPGEADAFRIEGSDLAVQDQFGVGNTWRYPGAYARASHH
jgi:hypothetical protein